jgi:hypothetical protein
MNELIKTLQSTSHLINQYLPKPPTGQSNLGYLILGIILSPVVVLLLMSVLGHPRKMKITILFLGFLIFMLGVFISVTYLLGVVTGIFF